MYFNSINQEEKLIDACIDGHALMLETSLIVLPPGHNNIVWLGTITYGLQYQNDSTYRNLVCEPALCEVHSGIYSTEIWCTIKTH